jgi:hypothetical protein
VRFEPTALSTIAANIKPDSTGPADPTIGVYSISLELFDGDGSYGEGVNTTHLRRNGEEQEPCFR